MNHGQIGERAHLIFDDMMLGWTSSWLRPRVSLGGPLVREETMIYGTCDVTYDMMIYVV